MEDLRLHDANISAESASVGSWVGLCVFGLLALLVLRQWLSKRSANLPPGPRGWPVIGNILDVGNLPHQSLMKLADRFGPVMFVKIGQVPTLVISSPDMAMEVFKTQDNLFGNRPRGSLGQLAAYNCQDIIFAHVGENWRYLRKMSVEYVFSASRIAAMESVRKEETMTMIQEILEDSQDGAVEMGDRLSGLIFNIQTRSLICKKYVSGRGRKNNVKLASAEEAEEAANFSRIIAGLGNLGHFETSPR